ncbi:MAG: TolC family protein [Proteiniphilum sp.]|nr:TolC family protein [Proteiniphilum sp.]
MTKKRISIVLITIGALFAIPSVKAQEQTKLIVDLNTAIDIALSENPSIKIADMEITKKQYSKKSAYGALFPQIDLIGQYQRTIKQQTMYMDGAFNMFGDVDPSKFEPHELEILDVLSRAMAPDPDADPNQGIQVGRKNMWSGGVNVSLPLVVPSLWKNIQLSQTDIEFSMEQARSSKIDLTNQVKKSFYNNLLAMESYEVFKETYRNDSINLVNIKNKYAQGIVAEYDVVTAEVRLKSIIPNILQAENAIKISELQLKMLMGIDADVEMEISGSLLDYEETMFNAIVPNDDDLSSNSDLKQFDLQTDMAQKGLEIQKMQLLPTLTSSFNYMYMSQNNDFKMSTYRWDPYSVAGITLAIPLFSGGQKRNNIKQSEIQLLQMKYQRKDIERGLKLSVKNNIEMMNKSIEQVVATESSVEQAKKGYEITQKRYDTGMGTIVDVNAAALAVTSAELQYRNAIYDYLAAKSDLEKTLGYDIDTEKK